MLVPVSAAFVSPVFGLAVFPVAAEVDPWFWALNFSGRLQVSAYQFCIVTRAAVWSSPAPLQMLSHTLWSPALKPNNAALPQKHAFADASSAPGRTGSTHPPSAS
jgi:hypothetical protein